MAIDGNIAFLASGIYGLSVVDIGTSPPVAKGGCKIPFIGEHVAVNGARDMAVVTGQSPDGTAHLWVLNTANLTNPTISGELPTTLPSVGDYSFKDVALTGDGTLAVVAAGRNGIWVVDVSIPSFPERIGTYDTPGVARGVTLNSSGTIAYVADGSSGLQILSLINPHSPSLLGSKTVTGKYFRDIALDEAAQMVYLVDENGTLVSVDVKTSAAPVVTSYNSFSAGAGRYIAIDETRDMMAVIESNATADSLEIFSTASPHSPAKPGAVGYVAVGSPSTAFGVALTGGYAYVAAASDGLKKYNCGGSLSFIPPPVNVPGYTYAVAVNSSYAYVTGFPSSISIIKLFAQ